MMFPKNNPVRSPAYLDFVRGHDCCACNKSPTVAHHFMEAMGGTGTKVSDLFTVPLCTPCHDRWHQARVLPLFENGDLDPALARIASTVTFYRSQARLLAEFLEQTGVLGPPGVPGGVF